MLAGGVARKDEEICDCAAMSFPGYSTLNMRGMGKD
jgi:hypothetical protein